MKQPTMSRITACRTSAGHLQSRGLDTGVRFVSAELLWGPTGMEPASVHYRLAT